ncbi:MAG: polysaccharide lyase family 7 protein [Polyangiaceae bacterium]
MGVKGVLGSGFALLLLVATTNACGGDDDPAPGSAGSAGTGSSAGSGGAAGAGNAGGSGATAGTAGSGGSAGGSGSGAAAGASGSSGATSTLPSAVLDLTNWKLTLPIGNQGSPTEVEQPALATFAHPEHFFAQGDHVVFRAHAGGTTTSGSSYPRSELREMINAGADLASWSTTSGTHSMRIKQAITHLPVVKPHVVAGQIHDANDDVIVFRLEDKKLFVDINGTTGPTLDANYQLGSVFTVQFVAEKGAIKALYNGTLAHTLSIDVSGCYFKAGTYTQSNLSKGDAAAAYGEVQIYELEVTHTN